MATASTRPNRTSRSTPRSAIAQTPGEAVTAIAREGARIQLAAFSAAGKALASWARAADRLVHAVGDQLLRRVDGQTDSRELIIAVAASTAEHLHDLTALPRAAANHFDARLARVPIDNRRPR